MRHDDDSGDDRNDGADRQPRPPVEPLSETDVRERFAQWFTEGDLEYRDARHTFNYQAALGVLAERFDVDAGPGDDAFERELLESRATVDRHEYTRDCIASTNTEVILADDGFPDTSPAEFREYTDADVYPLLRLESLAESLIDDHAEFGAFEDALVDRMASALEGEYVALKTIVAYRRGLNVGTVDRADAGRRSPTSDRAGTAASSTRGCWIT